MRSVSNLYTFLALLESLLFIYLIFWNPIRFSISFFLSSMSVFFNLLGFKAPVRAKKIGGTQTCKKWLSEAPEAVKHIQKDKQFNIWRHPWQLLTAPRLGITDLCPLFLYLFLPPPSLFSSTSFSISVYLMFLYFQKNSHFINFRMASPASGTDSTAWSTHVREGVYNRIAEKKQIFVKMFQF